MDLNELELVSENSYSLSKEDITYFAEFNFDIVNMVKELKQENQDFKKTPIDLSLVIKHLGLNAIYKENVENLVKLDEINKIIEINKDEVKIEFKFYKIAKEIASYYLNQKLGKVEEKDLNRIKLENIFAIELLMPYNETRNKIMLGYSVENLSKHFNVTDEIARNRYNNIYNRIY